MSPVLAAEADLALASLCLARLEAVLPSSPGPGLGEVLARATERDRGELEHGACLSCHVYQLSRVSVVTCHVSRVPSCRRLPGADHGYWLGWAGPFTATVWPEISTWVEQKYLAQFVH